MILEPTSLFADGGSVTGAGLGGAFFASTRLGLAPALVLGRLSMDGNPPSVGEWGDSSKLISNDVPNVSLELEMDLASDENVGLGSRGAVADVGVEMPEPDVAWLVLGRIGVRGAGIADRRGSKRSKSAQAGSDSALSASEDGSWSGGGPGRLPRGRPFDMGKSPSIGGRENGLDGSFSAGLGGGSVLI